MTAADPIRFGGSPHVTIDQIEVIPVRVPLARRFSGSYYSMDNRVTIVTRGAPHVLMQIEAQLEKMVATRHVQDVTRDPNGLERELALVKVKGSGADRVEALRVSDIFRAKVIDTTHESFVFEVTGASAKIDRFIELMRPLGLVEVSRTGVLSIQRGVEVL